MVECPKCLFELDKEDVEFDCPFCGEMDMGEGFYTCPNCDALFDFEGNLWECEFCNNEGKTEKTENTTQQDMIDDDEYCPVCGEELEYMGICPICGWPNNQGWIGEHYG